VSSLKTFYGGYFCQATPEARNNIPGYKVVIPSYNNHESWVPADFFDLFFKELTQ
jgi:hypothetical protein